MKLQRIPKSKKRPLPSFGNFGPFVLLFLLAGFCRPLCAKDFDTRPEVLVSTSANCAYQTTPFSLPFSFEAQMGLTVGKLYLGYGVDYWVATESITATAHRLNYVSVGAEAGFVFTSPRMFWLITGAVYLPGISSITDATGTTYTPPTTTLSYRGRLVAGLRLTSVLALTLGGGYRLQNLGTFASGGTPYHAGALDLTGLFFTAGFTFTL